MVISIFFRNLIRCNHFPDPEYFFCFFGQEGAKKRGAPPLCEPQVMFSLFFCDVECPDVDNTSIYDFF